MAVVVIGCLVFVAVGAYNAWRAWRWTEIPEVLEGREHLIPVQIPVLVFFAGYPIAVVVHALLGNPPNGSPGSVASGAIGAAIGLTGGLLGVSTYWFGRPQRLIAPIVRDVPRWSPLRRRAEEGGG
jgi:hypothetical protein